MASPALSTLEFSMVGDIDSDWYGINLLDSASTSIDGAGDASRAFGWQTLNNRVDNPISINIDDSDEVKTFTKALDNIVGDNPTLGSDPGIEIVQNINLTINPIERWY